MVTRKPVPENAVLDPALLRQAQDAWSPSHGDVETIWGDEVVQRQRFQRSNVDSTPADIPSSLRPGAPRNVSDFGDDNNVWAEGVQALADMGDMSRVPSVLRPGSGHGKGAETGQTTDAAQGPVPIPGSLRPGGGLAKPETNPFRRISPSGQPAVAKTPPNHPSVPALPIEEFSHLSVSETSSNPWQPTGDEDREAIPPVPRLPEQDSAGDNVWASAKPSRQPTPGARAASPAVLSLPSEEDSGGWEEEPKKPTISPPLITTADEDVLEDSNAWDDLRTLDKGKGLAQPLLVPNKGTTGADEWNLIDMDPHPGPPSRQSTWENFQDENDVPKKTPAVEETDEAPPVLPPRRSAEAPPPAPPRPVDKSETYQIKNINWHDATAAKNPRLSPILVQNANGPCPLVALVNALTLTTPADKSNTALVETLRSREQVSLGLLLDAVFDELMSERRMRSDVPLPDVTELYNFLKGLHTGMNVNPRFVPTPEVVTAFKRTSLTHLHPTERTDTMIPGTFEHTREMALYSTFSIPLIHGWLPSKADAVYEAFARQAASYEDAQNLLFREEELEEKLCNRHQGLTPEEQQMYQDILTIKSFLSISATQLTRFGLDVIKKAMKPGSVAILFRNDHFATLYRHPQTLELLTLVTDAGYAGHAEVVWESLVDVKGENAEFLSGDFRVVGGATHDQPRPAARDGVPDSWMDAVPDGGNDEWTTVQGGRRGRSHAARTSPPPGEGPLSPNHEQEDRDLALALQLQEEEDERARAEQERRRRESALSEQFIEQQARSTNPAPATGPNGARGRTRGASHSATSLTSSTGTATSSVGTATGRRTATRSASASVSSPSQQAITSTSSPSLGSGATRTQQQQQQRPTTQTVRPLVPPRNTPAATSTTTDPTTTTTTTTTRLTNRPAEDGLDDVPPSYEQAAKQLPYLPPAGHPSHPASSPAASGAESASQGAVGGQYPGLGLGQGQGPRSASGAAVGGYPGVSIPGGRDGYGYRRGVPPAGAARVGGNGNGRERDRECVVM